MIPYGRQEITDSDIDEVEKVLKSDFLTQGPVVPKFEKVVANYCGASYAVAVNSATSALHIACLALGLEKGDYLWTSPNTFVASANCARYCGAGVDFVDINPDTFNINVEALSEKLKVAEKKGKLPKIIIPVHFAGQPSEMEAIHKLSKKFGFKIIEDASHAIGASYNEIKVGSCVHSDITVFSFHPVKIITTGEGGMALTNKKDLADKMYRLRVHGITYDKGTMHQRPKNEIWNYQQIELGFNYRMNDIQAALGLSQIKRLDHYITKRHNIAKRYNKEFESLSIKTQKQLPGFYSSFHLYSACFKENKNTEIQKKIYDTLRKNGIAVNVHYIPVHRHPYYENLGFKKEDFPEAEKFYRESISLPIYPSLSYQQQDFVLQSLASVLKNI
ncbi:UDP-4-amino-4,6-dideoxy-N-acetyl-beta-L-altrosamine transaminase [Candidatus Pelagibacter sp. FZCC0015]|uniref:UDP-4-amino-4, 6-dideoxy-N-acetyl-beta-L-altrosamine transaminase n=1 Tax=Candidatus Pelagibacter sp. FZCC0015 TaxID=2268451 RepID=UPI0011A076A2|nr:UDP-4-amino-4,6-dideoxy-N-acetyl-beta-L-altrosamine transaminase [Candidatus Pelagibacter sp. FZCC0015]